MRLYDCLRSDNIDGRSLRKEITVSNIVFRGIVPALLTATQEDGSFCEAGMRELVEHVIQEGAGGVLALGTTGEPTAWSYEERKQILKVVIDQAGGRVPVMAGCGAPSTKQTIQFCQMAEEMGADALAVVTPYYITPTQEDLIEHYKKVAEACSQPVYLYNIPQRTGVTITPETAACLKQVPGVAGIKDSGGDFSAFRRFMELNDDSFQVIQGIDAWYLESFRIGCTAGISGPANSILKNQKAIYDTCCSGEYDLAEVHHQRFMKLKALIGQAPGPTVPKEAANIAGLHVGPPVSPLRRPEGELLAKLKQVMNEEFKDCFTGGSIK